jgi:hypothetical protein
MNLNRWKNFTKRQQLLTIGSEFMRAKVWQEKDREKFLLALERALGLIDLTLSDEKWRSSLQMILVLREEVAKFFIAQRKDNFSSICHAL